MHLPRNNLDITWYSGSVLEHSRLPRVFESRLGISEGCFIFHFASLPLEVVRPIQPTTCTKVAVNDNHHHHHHHHHHPRNNPIQLMIFYTRNTMSINKEFLLFMTRGFNIQTWIKRMILFNMYDSTLKDLVDEHLSLKMKEMLGRLFLRCNSKNIQVSKKH